MTRKFKALNALQVNTLWKSVLWYLI